MTRRPDRRKFLMFAAMVLTGCATRERGKGDGKYPPWLIKVADPVAPAIGFTISHVQWRDGYLKHKEDALGHIRLQLQPLDILVFSSKGRLSGHTGSGLFGHSAIYLGTPVELQALGLFYDAEVAKHEKALERDRLVVESAQRHNTGLSTLAYVGDTDLIAILRPEGISRSEKKQAIRRGFERVGRKFDHHFRLDTPDKLFCTELIDQVLPQLKLPRHEVYGREIIYPDDLVKMAARSERLDFVAAVAADRKGWRKVRMSALIADIAAAGG